MISKFIVGKPKWLKFDEIIKGKSAYIDPMRSASVDAAWLV